MSSRYGNTKRQLEEQVKYYEDEWSKYYWNEFVLKYEDKINWRFLSQNSIITWNIVKDNPDKPWDWYALLFNPNITWDIVVDNPDKPWGWNWVIYLKIHILLGT